MALNPIWCEVTAVAIDENNVHNVIANVTFSFDLKIKGKKRTFSFEKKLPVQKRIKRQTIIKMSKSILKTVHVKRGSGLVCEHLKWFGKKEECVRIGNKVICFMK